MTPRFRRGSLRGRLLLSTSVVSVLSLVAVTWLHAAAADHRGLTGRLSRLLLGDELPEPWQDLAILLPFSLLLLLLISAVTVWNLRPLLRASDDASRVGPRNPAARIAAGGLPDELAPLVRAFNGALDRLGGAYEAERRFTADAAHELRTPLAALRLRLQRARNGGGAIDWPGVERDLAQMSRLVSQLLALARKDASATDPAPPFAPVNLARTARETAAAILPLVEQAGRALAVDLPDALPVHGRADDLEDLLRNVMENALTHGRGTVAIAGRIDGTAGSAPRVLLDVSDDGDGVPLPLRDAMFDRFRKGRQDGAGSGLGLAIARAVATAHGGTIGFADGTPCLIRLVLPLGAGRADATHGRTGAVATRPARAA